jgi:hypothetical protein
VRAGPPYSASELGWLARAFDDMAARLEARAREARETTAALSASEERFRHLVEGVKDHAMYRAARRGGGDPGPRGAPLGHRRLGDGRDHHDG